MAGGERHWRTGDVYLAREDGLVEVQAKDGTVGLFDRTGRWVSGEYKWADLHMVEFVAGVSMLNAQTTEGGADHAGS